MAYYVGNLADIKANPEAYTIPEYSAGKDWTTGRAMGSYYFWWYSSSGTTLFAAVYKTLEADGNHYFRLERSDGKKYMFDGTNWIENGELVEKTSTSSDTSYVKKATLKGYGIYTTKTTTSTDTYYVVEAR